MPRTAKITDFIFIEQREKPKQNATNRTTNTTDCCSELMKYAERCNAREVLAYLLRYPSVGILRIQQDLSWLKARGIKLTDVLECLNRSVIKVTEYVVNLDQRYWDCNCILTDASKKL